MTDDLKTVTEALADVHRKIGAMEKKKVQSFQAFLVDDVYARIGPLLAEEGIVMIPEVRDVEYLDRETVNDRGEIRRAVDARVRMDYVFIGPMGDDVTMTFAAEGRDYGDKATNKAVQQALKYGLIQMFMISTGEADPDQGHVEVAPISENLGKKIFLDALGGDTEKAAKVWGETIDEDPTRTPEETLRAALQAVVVDEIPIHEEETE